MNDEATIEPVQVDAAEQTTAIAVRPQPDSLDPWLDAISLAIAAGVRVGERGLARTEPANVNAATAREREVMDADEAATFLGIDRKTVYEYAGRGELPHRRLGKRLLFSRQALVLWLSGACSRCSSDGVKG
jgi:excisionase family DNA binding protein